MFKCRQQVIFSCLSAILLLVINTASLAGEKERYDLVQVAKEVDFLIKQVENIKDESRTTKSNIVFHYDDLLHDLHTIKNGISDFVSMELRNGNKLRKIDGRYR